MKKRYALILGALLAAPSMAAQNCSSDLNQTAPNGRFAKFDNGTVKDLQTGLTWMRCPLGESWDSTDKVCKGETSGMLWPSALSEVKAINESDAHKLHKFGGIEKWRLPNVKELVSLKEAACFYPAMNAQAFPWAIKYIPGEIKTTVWSATPSANGSDVFIFDTNNGSTFATGATSTNYAVILVAEE